MCHIFIIIVLFYNTRQTISVMINILEYIKVAKIVIIFEVMFLYCCLRIINSDSTKPPTDNNIAIIPIYGDNVIKISLFNKSGLAEIILAVFTPLGSENTKFQYGIREVVFKRALSKCMLAVTGKMAITS